MPAVLAAAGFAALPPGQAAAQTSAVLLAAGDIASCTSTGDEATAFLLDQNGGLVATLGDNAYPSGTPAEFAQCYDPSWGRARFRTRPSAGNHDYFTPGAAGYFGYFGAAAGDPSTGYYSYDLGAWHIVVVNSNCSAIGGCEAGSPQERWLRADLAAYPRSCTLAYWHHPRFSSGRSVQLLTTEPLWKALYQHGADVVLSGHDHIYERFAPQTPIGDANAVYGIRQFTVGTGGHSHSGLPTRLANSEVVNNDTFGILKLTLHPESYEWAFLPEPGRTFTDFGSGTCHDGPSDVTAPTASLTAPSDATVVRGPVRLAANASDETGLARVDFLVDSTVVASDPTAPYSVTWDSNGFADGVRTLTARAVDSSGNATTSDGRTITIDNTEPETTIVRGPSGTVASTAARFVLASEPGATFECALDGEAFSRCANPTDYADLRPGPHSFRVRARDAVGKLDPTPATRDWSIDVTAPDTAFTFRRTSRGPRGSATFRFATTEPGASLRCSLDGAPWVDCTSPWTYRRLGAGRHSFEVLAIDAARNEDPTPAVHRWFVSSSSRSGVVITASSRAETINGTQGDDIIRGAGGNDVLRGRGGHDVVSGGTGDDRLDGGFGRDRLFGDSGNDTLAARDRRRDVLDGGTGKDRGRYDPRLDRARRIETRF